MSDRVRVEVERGIATIVMDDGKVNAIRDEWLDGMDAALTRAEADDVRALILRGRPGVYSAGFDIRHLPTLEREARLETVWGYGAMLERLWTYPKPLVTAVTGHAIAGGAIVCMCGDRRIGVLGDYKIGLNEIAIGLPLPSFVIAMAQGLLSPTAMQAALLEGQTFSPERAETIGYLTDLVNAPELDTVARHHADKLASFSPAAYRHIKEGLRRHVSFAAYRDEFESMVTRPPFGPA